MNYEEMLEPSYRISRDMIKAMKQDGNSVTHIEARFLVDSYYSFQKARVAANNQIKGLARDAKKFEREEEPHEAIDWIFGQFEVMENNIKKILGAYSMSHDMYWFFEQTKGVGPVLSAGLLAHIDIHKAPTAGAIWSYGGLNPDATWEKGKKRPWNADFKLVCWKLGSSFQKLRKDDVDSYYGQLYRKRKAYEVKMNEAYKYRDQAAKKLEKYNIGKATDAYAFYSKGLLPPAHIDQRAMRYATKIFLSHLHQCWHEQEIGPVPKPFAIAHLGHVHELKPPQHKIGAPK